MTRCKTYSEFIRTFLFSSPQEPIVQPGSDVPYPDEVARSGKIAYVDDAKHGAGLIVARGTYLVQITLNPGGPAQLALLVNGQLPTSIGQFPYTQQNVDPDSELVT